MRRKKRGTTPRMIAVFKHGKQVALLDGINRTVEYTNYSRNYILHRLEDNQVSLEGFSFRERVVNKKIEITAMPLSYQIDIRGAMRMARWVILQALLDEKGRYKGVKEVNNFLKSKRFRIWCDLACWDPDWILSKLI